VHAPSEEKSGDSKDSFYEELEQVLIIRIPKYHMKIRFGDFNANVGRESNFKRTIRNKSLQQDSNDDGVKTIYFASSKNLVLKNTMFPHRNFHKHTWTSHYGKNHN
jgi:hypothetical protein